MQGREIPECMEAFKALKIPKVWFKGFREWELAPAVYSHVMRTDYDSYILASDDLVPTQTALDVVLEGLQKHEAFTGWCNMSPSNPRANVRLTPFTMSRSYFLVSHLFPSIGRLTASLKGMTFPNPDSLPENEFRVYSTGFAFTGMSRELWLRFPLAFSDGSDYMLTNELLKAGIEIWSHKKAFFYHLASRQNFIIGNQPSEVIFEP